MPQHQDTLQRLLDRAAIEDVITRYFHGIDRCDPGCVRNCFTEDICASYDGREEVKGIEPLMDSMNTFKRHKAGTVRITTHFMGNLNFCSLYENAAETETSAIAFLAMADEMGTILMRSLRYLDQLRRTSDGWRICERVHTLDWSCEMAATFANTLATRRMSR
ncbi:nuclear transport factor 2 family protein [Pigmentiphaga sp.]|uniref:nuclear transport factor 2 family protein n=1 Tax=Pigmentiphaga sp. TaxID=1977564 RepID=UPI00128BB4C3|nr:nuclear transport factor 2 family protein [Pigmentiphaga sp.]MPS28074.1 nuclear transport factor 2 family protein [Alcaligenaceae bacterium SAGV5]MPS54589.1 nuclear transport factor 2 family protein [Alcaligenaceae bacterium SAGV3]MPT57038.1 nuclear transport factor 2 family protein [Alcaligenaceae bacterium]